jgi:hypothetical protein
MGVNKQALSFLSELGPLICARPACAYIKAGRTGLVPGRKYVIRTSLSCFMYIYR